MKINRTRNATRNIVWGVVERLIGVILPFITRTVMIKTIGAEYIGLSGLFTSILQVLNISELGIGSAIVFSMYKPIAEEDNDLICALLNIYRKIYYVIGSIILVVGLALIPFLPGLIAGKHPSDVNIYVLYLMYLANTVISYYLFAYKQALFSAYQRNDLVSKRSSVISMIGSVLQISLLLTTHNYYAYAFVIPLSTVLTNTANAILANRMFPNIVCHGNISQSVKKDIQKRIVGLLSFKIYNVIFSSVDTIVISSFLGLTPLAIYNNYYYVQTAIVGFLTVLTTSITAGVGNKMITNSKEDNYEDFKNFTFANGWLCSWCAVCLFCLYQHFMLCWVGEGLVFNFGTMTLMVLYFLLPRITTITYTFREAAGLWWEDRFRPLVAAAVNLSMNILLVKIIGINGVIISTLICTVFINVPWGSIILFRNYFKRSPSEYFLKTVYYILITAVACGITFAICQLLPKAGIFVLLIKGAICCIVPNVVFFIFYRNMKEYKYLKDLTKKIVCQISSKLHL